MLFLNFLWLCQRREIVLFSQWNRKGCSWPFLHSLSLFRLKHNTIRGKKILPCFVSAKLFIYSKCITYNVNAVATKSILYSRFRMLHICQRVCGLKWLAYAYHVFLKSKWMSLICFLICFLGIMRQFKWYWIKSER